MLGTKLYKSAMTAGFDKIEHQIAREGLTNLRTNEKFVNI
jgi:hypothetical protein